MSSKNSKKRIFTKAKFILVVLLFIVSAQGIYLISSPRLSLNSFNTAYRYRACDKFQDLGSQQQCWEDLIEETLNKQSLDSAFNLVDFLYSNEPQFASDCHGFTHQLGEKAYQLFSQNQDIKLTSKASYCGFGFYHAFMESLLRTTGDLNQARQFCDYVGKQSDKNELSRLSCFHGIGHGLLEDIPNTTIKGVAEDIIEKPLTICVELSQSEVETYRCASGVFNVLAIYYANSKAVLAVDKKDPYAICRTQSRRSFKEACYDQMNSLVLSLGQGDLSKAAKFTKSIQEDDLASAAIHGLAGAYGQSWVSKTNYDDVVKICQNMQPRLTSSCLEGFLLGMLEGGKPGEEYIEGRELCNSDLLNDQQKASCFNNLIWNTSVTNPKKLAELCNSLEPRYRQDCNSFRN